MPRTLITDPLPAPPGRIAEDFLAITPNECAARALGVPRTNIYDLARKAVQVSGFGIASPLAASAALSEAMRKVMRSAHGASPGLNFRATLSSMLRSGIDLERLGQLGSRRVKTAARIAAEYVDSLRSKMKIDRESAIEFAIRSGKIEKQKVLVYGYFRSRQFSARPQELEFIDAIAAEGSIFYLPCADLPVFDENRRWRDELAARGWEVSSNVPGGRDDSVGRLAASAFADPAMLVDDERVRAVSYLNISDEARGMLARAKSLIVNGSNAASIAVACRDIDAYSMILKEVSEEYGLKLDIGMEIPLRSTAIGEFVTLLFESVSFEADDEIVLDFEAAVRMLRHRLGPGIDPDAWPQILRKHPLTVKEWAEFDIDLSFFDDLIPRTLADWLSWIRGVLDRFGSRAKAALSAADLVAYNTFLDGINDLALIEGDRAMDLQGAAAEVELVLDELSAAFDPSAGGVRVLEPNEIVGGRFDHLFVIGAGEGILPAGTAEDATIDLLERKRLANHGVYFEDAGEIPRWEALSFLFALLSAETSITLSFPHHIGGDEILPSSYFGRLGLRPAASENLFLSSAAELLRSELAAGSVGTHGLYASASTRLSIEKDREGERKLDEFNGAVGPALDAAKLTWSASQLTQIGQCPFKWFAAKVLRASEAEEAEIELGASTRGSLYHKVLEVAVMRSMGRADLRAAILEVLESAMDEAEASGEFPITRVAHWELQRSEHLDILRNAVSSSIFIDDGAAVIAVEEEYEADWNGLRLRGKLDRIDRTPNGLQAIDYKTGSSSPKIKDESGSLKIDLQLPVYSQAALPELYPREAITAGRYIRLRKRTSDNEKPADLENFAESVRSIVASGRFTPEPDDKQKACEWCEFDPVCRHRRSSSEEDGTD